MDILTAFGAIAIFVGAVLYFLEKRLDVFVLGVAVYILPTFLDALRTLIDRFG